MTPPTARKRPAAARSAAATRPAEADAHRFVGADHMDQQPGQRIRPAGVTHVVDGWQPVCGGPRVKFAFPGCTLDDATEICDACAGQAATVRRVPRQRPASAG